MIHVLVGALPLLSGGLAGDPAVWVGGAGSAQLGYQKSGLAGTEVQAELDARVEQGPFYFRADLDFTLGLDGGAHPVMFPPEWLMIQYSPGAVRLRAGVVNPNIGLEDWDPWNNYLPTFSILFNGASPGRVLGGEVAYQVGNAEVFAFGGADMDFVASDVFIPELTPIAGLGVWAEGESLATWSGLALYPTESYYGAFAAVEYYPLDQLWVSLDGGLGLSAGEPFAGAQLVVNVMPEAVVAPVARVEGVYDPGGVALGGADAGVAKGTFSLGARLQALASLSVMAEGKLTLWGSGLVDPGVFIRVTGFRPEPPTYTALTPEE